MRRAKPQIPDHQILRKIGSGAYGEVWLARAITGAWRAIKIVRREDFDDDRSFQREFEGIRHYEPVARNHPGLVHILHVGSSQEPSPFYYYVMELGDDATTGSDISPDLYKPRTLQTDKKLAPHSPLQIDYVLEIGIQLSGALAYLHSLDLTHRDIKPANVIFVHNHPKLADVGLVAQRGQRTFVGTEGFIPHEGPGTRRADVYALGKVLYELATGKDRLDFPELPEVFPDDFDQKRWLSLNQAICSCCEPDLNRYHIDSAAKLYHILKEIKKGKPFAAPQKTIFSSPGRMLAALSGIALAFTLVMVSLFFLFPGDSSPDTVPPAPLEETGYVHINSLPADADIYAEKNSQPIGKTPYTAGPFPSGTKVTYTLKKEGFCDWTETKIVLANKPVGIGGALTPFSPPVKGQNWSDSENHTYLPFEGEHRSNTPITAESMKHFLADKKTDRKVPFFSYKLPDSESPQLFALISPGEAMEYSKWVTEQSIKKGLLSKKESIIPIPLSSWKDWQQSDEDKKNALSAYLLQAGEVHYVNARITSQPEGATVTINGVELGRTPIDSHELSPGYYSITFKLPGYARYETTGIIEKNKPFLLHGDLMKDGSVEFNREWKNSLGMEFVPLKENFSVSKYETRNSDFQNYLLEEKLPPLPAPQFQQDLDHPVVNVSREQARQFADWLTRKEQLEGLLESTDYYRLPTDSEWTAFAGGAPEKEKYPSTRHKENLSPDLGAENSPDLFPWGNTWPPPSQSGNFADTTSEGYLKKNIIPHYNDNYPYTAPVGSFTANRLGLYDITGNVWEWVDDNFGGSSDFPFKDYEVARGGGWLTYKPQQLLTRYRVYLPPDKTTHDVGFRLVLVRQIVKKATSPQSSNGVSTEEEPPSFPNDDGDLPKPQQISPDSTTP